VLFYIYIQLKTTFLVSLETPGIIRIIWYNLVYNEYYRLFANIAHYILHNELQPSNIYMSFTLYHQLLNAVRFQGEKWNRTERLLGLHDGVEKERKGRPSRNQTFCEESNKRRHIP
jgi:hypothetical protein